MGSKNEEKTKDRSPQSVFSIIMRKSIQKKLLATGLILSIIIPAAFFISILNFHSPPLYLRDKIQARYKEQGGAKMYGYTFVDWNALNQSEHKQDYINLVTTGLDFAFVHCQWSVVGKSGNETLNLNYLGNLSWYIRELAKNNTQVVIHIWVSSYSPAWIFPLVPELVNQPDRWVGFDPNSLNSTYLEHRTILKNSMIHYVKLLSEYFINAGLMNNIRGWCLDDETQSEYWSDFFDEIATTLLNYNASWRIGAMFNRYDKYHLTGETRMNTNYMDPYDLDPTFIEKIHYAWDYSGVDNISVLIDAMGPHESAYDNKKIRRQAWIAWFLGADSIGWYTYLYPTDKWACVKWNGGTSPIITEKTQSALNAKIDIDMLNKAYENLAKKSDEAERSMLFNKLLKAYEIARNNDFSTARTYVLEVINA